MPRHQSPITADTDRAHIKVHLNTNSTAFDAMSSMRGHLKKSSLSLNCYHVFISSSFFLFKFTAATFVILWLPSLWLWHQLTCCRRNVPVTCITSILHIWSAIFEHHPYRHIAWSLWSFCKKNVPGLMLSTVHALLTSRNCPFQVEPLWLPVDTFWFQSPGLWVWSAWQSLQVSKTNALW